MPTTTDFTYLQSNFSIPAITGYPIDNGTYYTIDNGRGAELAVDWFGTDASIYPFRACLVSIDGGAFDASSGGSFAARSIGSGLTNGWHTSIIRGSDIIQKSPALTITSSTTPATRFPAGYGISYEAWASATQACVKYYGAWFEDNTYKCMHSPWWGNGIIITTTGANTGLRLYGYSSSKQFDLYVDGVFNATITFNQNWGSQQVVSGLTPGCMFTTFAQRMSPRKFTLLRSVRLAERSTRRQSATERRSRRQATALRRIANPTFAGAFVALIAATRGWDAINLGVSGAVTPVGGSLPEFTDGVLRVPPKYLLVYFGSNDKLGSSSAATFKTHLQAYLQNLLDGTTLHATGLRKPTTQKIIVLRPLQWLKDQDATYDQAVLDAVAALSLPANSPDVITHDSSAVSGSALHPDQTHTAAIAADLLSDIPADGAGGLLQGYLIGGGKLRTGRLVGAN